MLRISSFAAATAVGLLAVAGIALGDGHKADEARDIAAQAAPYATGGEEPAPMFTWPLRQSSFAPPDHQHGGSAQHLPAARENIDVVGKLELDTPDAFKFDPTTGAPDPTEPDLVAGQIADLAVYKRAAYLNSWSEPSCRRGGFFSADISDPANPSQLAFVPALPETYHGEGAHARTLNTPSFQGDVLIVNNEPCGAAGVGGFDLYDVSDPANPQILVQGAGDQSPDDTSEQQDPTEVPNSSHSSFVWQDGPRAYAVIVDNTELHDVDIFDITDPRNPVFVGDHDLVELAAEQGVDIIDNSANGDAIFLHDMVVKEIGGVQTLLASYWDAGYVKVNVEDPANPLIIGDSAFDQQDPLVTDPETGQGFDPPEGNGHQAEFSHDNRFVMAADEDFSPYRTKFDITTGPNPGRYPSAEFGFSRPIATLADRTLNGPTVFGGRGCDVDPAIPQADSEVPESSLAEDEEQIVVISRGGCRFDEKIQNAEDAGYEAAVIGNSHLGSDNGASPDATVCGGGDPRNIRAMCIGHRAMHLLFNDPPAYTGPDGADIPLGTNGEKMNAVATFDGWGYLHLYRNDGNDLTKVDDFAIDEATDERYASGFGDLSVHEVATDPTANLAYSSYYAGGLRVFAFDDSGIRQVGKFIDEGGSNFWGIEQFTDDDGFRLMAGSDRDFGLYIVRYTGPGAVVPQSPGQDPGAPVGSGPPEGPSAAVPEADCQGRTVAKRSGTNGDDDLVGTVGPDAIFGRAGDDTENGLDGPDCLLGEEGDDTLKGGGGEDLARGGDGDDKLRGNGGKDKLQGEAGVDKLGGGEGSDRIIGGPGDDKLTGGPGKDRIRGSGANDEINSVDAKRDRVKCGSGDDRATVDPIDEVSRNCDTVVVVDHG